MSEGDKIFSRQGINRGRYLFTPMQAPTPTLKGNIMNKTLSLPLSLSPARLLAAATFSLGALLAACSGAMPARMEGGMLVGHNGMTLYTFDKDTDGKSLCNGKCAENWPPLYAEGAPSGDFSVITRDDGRKQFAYKGKPLYFWIKDQKPGDKTGDGFNGVWHVAK